jgi:hypothetical protein
MLIQDDYCLVPFAINMDMEDEPTVLGHPLPGFARYAEGSLVAQEKRPLDELLRWHLRQAVLFNMRGAVGPSYFDPDDDLAHGGQVDLSDAVWSSPEGRQ